MRAKKHSLKGIRQHNSDAFDSRLRRVSHGVVRSALDEFLAQRVPVQLGGMQDPFSPLEATERVTERVLDVLHRHDYPTLISTKGPLVAEDSYISRLREMNVSVRLSAAGVNEKHRSEIERDCLSYDNLLKVAEKLAKAGIPTTIRIQPILPGQEDHVPNMIRQASSAGVRHVSVEFLKLPVESKDRTAGTLGRILGYDLKQFMRDRGTIRVGPDFTLGTKYKLDFWKEIRGVGHALGVTMGAGDTELIHLSDGQGCCNGSSLLLRSSNVFTANFTGILKSAESGGTVNFDQVLKAWSPKAPVSTYLMTDSRNGVHDDGLSDWQSLMAARWNKSRSVYSPEFFAGVSDTGKIDGDGRSIYAYSNPI